MSDDGTGLPPFPRRLSDFPAAVLANPRVQALAADPAHAGQMSPGSVREALAALAAEEQGLIDPPVRRYPGPEGDLMDGAGRPIDVKTPPSFPNGTSFHADPGTAALALEGKAGLMMRNGDTGVPEPCRILFDHSWSTEEDTAKIMADVTASLGTQVDEFIIPIRITAAWLDGSHPALQGSTGARPAQPRSRVAPR